MGLGSEFLLPITHTILQQILEHQKVIHTNKRSSYVRNLLYQEEENYDEGSKIRLCNTPLQVFQGSSKQQAATNKTPQWNPTIQQISENEVAKYERQEERKERYEKRKK